MDRVRLSVASLAACAALISNLAAEPKSGGQFSFDGETYTLSAFDAPLTGTWNYFGVYAFSMEYTGGTLLHLFPNGVFVISEWLDIGPDQFWGSGTFTVRGDRLRLSFSKVAKGNDEVVNRFSDLRLLWGNIEKKGYVTGFKVFIFLKPKRDELKHDSDNLEFMVKQVDYNDWEKVLHELRDLAHGPN